MNVRKMKMSRSEKRDLSMVYDPSNASAEPFNRAKVVVLCLKLPLVSYMSHVMRKPVFGVCDQVRHKLACGATVASWSLEISDIETRGIILSRQ